MKQQTSKHTSKQTDDRQARRVQASKTAHQEQAAIVRAHLERPSYYTAPQPEAGDTRSAAEVEQQTPGDTTRARHIDDVRRELADYIGRCETCSRMLWASGRRRSYGETAVRAYGPRWDETHLYCAPCWHGREPEHIIQARRDAETRAQAFERTPGDDQ